MKDILIGKDKMVPIIFRIFLAIFLSVTFSCTLLKKTTEDEIIVISEELINEFKSNEKKAIKKYKNKRVQVTGELMRGVERPEHSRHRKDEASAISLYEEHCYFIFYFDYDVTKKHSLKKGDKAIIQGSFRDFSKRMITEYDYEKKAVGEKYWQEFETSFFVFKGSEIISGTEETQR